MANTRQFFLHLMLKLKVSLRIELKSWLKMLIARNANPSPDNNLTLALGKKVVRDICGSWEDGKGYYP
jgi:hypothetical protein